MNERIKLLRKKLNISQDKFSAKINISRSHFSMIESGAKNVTDRVVADICREFNVNENWLREGTGEMFCTTDDFSLDDFLKQSNCTDLEMRIIKTFVKLYLKLPKEIRDEFINGVICDFQYYMDSYCNKNENKSDSEYKFDEF